MAKVDQPESAVAAFYDCPDCGAEYVGGQNFKFICEKCGTFLKQGRLIACLPGLAT